MTTKQLVGLTEAQKDELHEAFRRISYALHVAVTMIPGHSTQRESCWTCQVSAYATITSTRQQSTARMQQAINELKKVRAN